MKTGLTLIVLTADAERFHAALSMAAAHAASGAPTRIYFHGPAVRLLVPPVIAPADESRRSSGMPTLEELMIDARDLGTRFLVCQSGLELSGLEMSRLIDGCETSGPVAIMSDLGDDRLTMI